MKKLRKSTSKKSFNKKNILNILILIVIISLCAALSWFYFKKIHSPIHKDVKKICSILEKIDKKCKIIKCLNINNNIDFLTVKEFAGDTIGSIILEEPKNWEGPYTESLITYNDKPFSLYIVDQKSYIVPSAETILEDGAVIGKDIIFDENANIQQLLKQFPSLSPSSGCLIQEISLSLKK